MFFFKKIIAPLFSPLPLCLGILILGLSLMWFSRLRRVGKCIILAGVVLLALLSYDTATDVFLRPLEYRYPCQASDTITKLLASDVKASLRWVVVLGRGHMSDPQIPITAQISDESLVRLIEAIRLYRQVPGGKLVLSGGKGFDPASDAEVMARVASMLGVNKQDIILEKESKDTKDQARQIKKIVGGDRFVLVTSASHMPRAMALFEKQGMNPIPAPTGHLVRKPQGFDPMSFYPSSRGLHKIERAMHEYLGIAWAWLRGQI
ncbi:MAG: envelope biogenesis factor ElyC [Deltaproteobacteria bacterium]|nr:envelope biogenesis factor ElyC [Deltaproteobacteria bacterium]